NSFDLSWTNPDGQLAPIAAADYELCDAAGNCASGTASGRGLESLSDVAVTAAGDYTLKLKLVDDAGNVGTSSAPVHLRFDDGEPGAPRPRASQRWLNASDVADGYDELIEPA